MELVLALLALVIAAAAVAVPFVQRIDGLPIYDKLVVTLVSGETFEGLLASSRGGVLRLVEAFAIDESSRVSVDGELFLDRSKVAYIQKPGGGR